MIARGPLDAMLYDLLIAPFADFAFMRRALAGAFALSLAGAPVGVFLILRRMSLMGDAMAHAILPGAAIGYLVSGLSLGAMTFGGMLAGFAVALASGAVARSTALREDASMAAFYLISLALGVVIVSLRGSNLDLLHVLFGAVLALDDATLFLLASIASFTLAAFALLYRPLVMETLDAGFLRSVSPSGAFVHLAFLALLALNLIAGFHALGTLLAVGLTMLPAAGARLWTNDVTRMIAIAMAAGAIASLCGLLVSYHAGVPTGPAIILAAGLFYLASVVFGRSGGLMRGMGRRRHLEA